MNILVTGGSGGLSKAVVETLARDANNNVYFTYASSAYVAEQIVAAHANVTAVRGDFTDSGQLEDLSRQMLGWDVLVNNAWAGKPEGIHFHKLTQEALLRSFTNNVLPTVSVTQKALETFCEKKSGRIITVLTSYVVGVPPLGYSLYASTKAYLAQMAKSWAKEYGKMGITSNCVSPEFMRTGFTVGTDGSLASAETLAPSAGRGRCHSFFGIRLSSSERSEHSDKCRNANDIIDKIEIKIWKNKKLWNAYKRYSVTCSTMKTL